MNTLIRPLPFVVLLFVFASITQPSARSKSGGIGPSAAPTRARTLLLNGFSKKKIIESAADHNGSLGFKRFRSEPDTINVIAFRVEFKQDTSTATTGNGHFGGFAGADPKETRYYNSDTVYKFDNLPHDSAYFDRQMQFVRDYYQTVSRGRLYVDYAIFPKGANRAYSLDTFMTAYGPGEKKKDESYSEYNNRINIRLLRFVRDAIKAADALGNEQSPFAGLHTDPAGVLRDSLGRRTVFLIVHAGASYLTDGGADGYLGRNTPFDMIDAFISREFFGAYKDSLKLDTAGVRVKGAAGNSFVIDEIMMVCETANQDGLNFGIHGILVNQLARQIGIPDLYSTSSAVSAVGAFCIMDFYGYLAGQGFVPPWPSAWVRAFMGWDAPAVVPMGKKTSVNLKALCAASPGDTTIALVPINDHEYFLLENRQRSLVGGPDIFKYDTNSDKKRFINPDFSLKIDQIVSKKSDTSRVILKVKNLDASLPASGVVVWRVDENVVRDRLAYDFLNADSAYRAISLVEADGISDIGIEFQNAAFQVLFDAGGAEDVFPHFTQNRKTAADKDSTFFINSMGPWSRPSTHAHDGGQTYLSITVDTLRAQGVEVAGIRDYFVNNFIDSVFKITVSWDFTVPGWPKHTVLDSGEALFDPVACDLYKGIPGKEIVALSKKGRLYVWPASDTSALPGLADSAGVSVLTSSINPAMKNSKANIPFDTLLLDTVRFMHIQNANPLNPRRPFTFPTVINNKLFVPLIDSAIDVISGITRTDSAVYRLQGDIIPLPFQPSTYACKLEGVYWALGGSGGGIFCADTSDVLKNLSFNLPVTGTGDEVSAIAALPGETGMFVCIQNNSSLSIGSVKDRSTAHSIVVKGGIPPYTLVTGDINHDDTNEIVVCDSRKGIWVFKRNLTPALGWEKAPNDQATSSYYSEKNRASLPINLSPPALADVDGDGCLEIVLGGAGGLYALNFKGNPIGGWPAYLDNRFYRGNVDCSPAIVTAPQGSKSPLVVFSALTGENETFEIDHIVSTNKKSHIIIFRRSDGSVDSTYATATFIDSAIVSGDSLIATVALYSGLIDAVGPAGARPLTTIGSNQLYSRWPLSIGIGAPGMSPVLDSVEGDGSVDIIAIAGNGWVYRWKSRGDLIGATPLWKQAGGSSERSFSYGGALGELKDTDGKPLTFFSWPNPTDKLQTGGKHVVNFKYKFSGPAKNVRLDIFTYTGFHVFSKPDLSGSFPGWNTLDDISLNNFGSGVYRCRMGAEVGGKKYVQYWKMAVVK
jgi:hypothetical protein